MGCAGSTQSQGEGEITTLLSLSDLLQIGRKEIIFFSVSLEEIKMRTFYFQKPQIYNRCAEMFNPLTPKSRFLGFQVLPKLYGFYIELCDILVGPDEASVQMFCAYCLHLYFCQELFLPYVMFQLDQKKACFQMLCVYCLLSMCIISFLI